MRLAVFSDIHGNMRAWKRFMAMLPDLEADELVFCGDFFGGEGGPRIVEDLAAFPCVHWVLGNNDEYFLRSLSREFPHLAKRLLALPRFLRVEREGLRIDIMHGSPEDWLHGRLYESDLPYDGYEGADVVITGHTHCRMAGFAGKTLFLNPGSLGYPRDRNPAGFALLDLPSRAVRFVDAETATPREPGFKGAVSRLLAEGCRKRQRRRV